MYGRPAAPRMHVHVRAFQKSGMAAHCHSNHNTDDNTNDKRNSSSSNDNTNHINHDSSHCQESMEVGERTGSLRDVNKKASHQHPHTKSGQSPPLSYPPFKYCAYGFIFRQGLSSMRATFLDIPRISGMLFELCALSKYF